MLINVYSWHHRLFKETMKVCAQFTGRSYLAYIYDTHTNLCHYMRVQIVYLPLIILAHLVTLGLVGAAIIGWPLYLFGWSAYGKGILVVLGSLLALAASVTGLMFGLSKYDDYKREKRSARCLAERDALVLGLPIPKRRSFLSLIFDYVAAKKQGICPMITFTETEEDWTDD